MELDEGITRQTYVSIYDREETMKKRACLLVLLSAMMIIGLVACAPMIVVDEPEPIQTLSVEERECLASIRKVDPTLSPEMQSAQMDFARRMLQAVNDEHKDVNVVISPQSISMALGMTYFGAKEETAKEMAKVLGIEGMDLETVAAGYKAIHSAMNQSVGTKIKNANTIWVDEGFPIVEQFVTTMINAFLAPVEAIDLQGEKALPTINGWIKENTDGIIDKLFTEPFSDFDRLVLCNAILFEGKWTTPFEPERTRDSTFHGQTDMPCHMMGRNDDILGKDGEGYRAILLPYGEDERFAMVGVLPDQDVNDFIDSLDQSSFISLFEGYEIKTNANIHIPVLKVDEQIALSDTLKAMGMIIPFTESMADFSGMGEELFISSVDHRACIDVDESGTKAAAVTAITASSSCVREPWTFCADRPFIFFIYDSENDLVLFSSKVMTIKDK